MRRWKKQVDGTLEKERAERRSLFAGQRIGPFRHGRAALVVDEEARALDGPEQHAGQVAEKHPDERFFDKDGPVQGERGGGEALRFGEAGDDGGVQYEITGKNHGGPQLPREDVPAHERGHLHEHEQPGHPHQQRQQLLEKVQFVEQCLIIQMKPPWRMPAALQRAVRRCRWPPRVLAAFFVPGFPRPSPNQRII